MSFEFMHRRTSYTSTHDGSMLSPSRKLPTHFLTSDQDQKECGMAQVLIMMLRRWGLRGPFQGLGTTQLTLLVLKRGPSINARNPEALNLFCQVHPPGSRMFLGYLRPLCWI